MTAAAHALQWWIGRLAFVALVTVSLRFTYRLWQQARSEPADPAPPVEVTTPNRRTGRSFEPTVGSKVRGGRPPRSG